MMGTDCPVCKLIRTYLLFAVPLLAFVAASTMSEQGGARLWFARVELINILSWGSLAALVAIVAYRAYQEFYLPKSRERALEAMKMSLDEQDAGQSQLDKESWSSDRNAESGKD